MQVFVHAELIGKLAIGNMKVAISKVDVLMHSIERSELMNSNLVNAVNKFDIRFNREGQPSNRLVRPKI